MTQKYVYDEKTDSYIPEKEKIKKSNANWLAMLIWGLQIVLPFITGIAAYLYYQDKNTFLYNTAKETLNYSVTLIGYIILAVILTVLSLGLLSFIIYPLLGAYFIMIPLLGILKAYKTEVYRPHYTLRIIF